MLWTVAVILLVMWALGLVTGYAHLGFHTHFVGIGDRCCPDPGDPGKEPSSLAGLGSELLVALSPA